DVGGGESSGVGDGHVSVYAAQEGRVAGGDLVEVDAGGERAVGPEGVIPPAALDPGVGLRGGDVGADALLHLGKRVEADEVDGQLHPSGLGDVGMGVVEAGHCEGALEVDDLGLGAL